MSWIFLIAVLVFAYWLLAPERPFYNSVLFAPSRYPEGQYSVTTVAGVTGEQIFFDTTDGIKLNGVLFRHPNSDLVFLVNHGNAGNLTHRFYLAQSLMQAGASVFLYDYRGYGRSEGQPTVQGICDDGQAAYRYLVEKQQFTPEQIVLYGESLGTGVTCQLFQRAPVSGIILQSGFSSLVDAGKKVLPLLNIYPAALFPKPHLDNVSAVKGEHPPLLVLHGTQDTLLPVNFSRTLFASASEPKEYVELPDAAHNNMPDQETFVESIQRFLSRLS
jgi:uncharacterized protein